MSDLIPRLLGLLQSKVTFRPPQMQKEEEKTAGR